MVNDHFHIKKIQFILTKNSKTFRSSLDRQCFLHIFPCYAWPFTHWLGDLTPWAAAQLCSFSVSKIPCDLWPPGARAQVHTWLMTPTRHPRWFASILTFTKQGMFCFSVAGSELHTQREASRSETSRAAWPFFTLEQWSEHPRNTSSQEGLLSIEWMKHLDEGLGYRRPIRYLNIIFPAVNKMDGAVEGLLQYKFCSPI